MLVFGLETSCDETGLALWSDRGLEAEVLYSQIKKHAPHGGVVPEIAARDHLRILPILWRELFAQTDFSPADIDSIAYTAGPGLVGCLLTGHSFAQGLSLSLSKPLQAIHHLEGHLMSMVIGQTDWYEALMKVPPFLGCLFSGGHCMLLRVESWGHYEFVGGTCDDAVGEAFDKVAKMMGLPYPGGPALAALADGGQVLWDLPRPMYHSGDGMMSFSGLKTAARKAWHESAQTEADQRNLAASFQQACVDVILKKISYAVNKHSLDHVVISGGVSANRALRKGLADWCQTQGVQLSCPALAHCTDNGAMIALAGWWRSTHGCPLSMSQVKARWPLADLVSAK